MSHVEEVQNVQLGTIVESAESEIDQLIGDDLMAQWDEEIWAQESATIVAETTTPQKSASAGWMAGLAAFAPSVLRRRRKQDE